MSNIEWTEKTWNPTIGCDKVSEGCKNCYAMNMSNRLQGIPASKEKYAGVVERTAGGALNWTGKINLHYDSLDKPLRESKPAKWFVNSMSDLFHKDIPFEFIDEVYQRMYLCKQHIFQVLTKREDVLVLFYQWKASGNGHRFDEWPLKNVHVGVSVENQKAADLRIPALLRIPAAVRWLSMEPLLGPVDLRWTDYFLSMTGEKYTEYLNRNSSISQHESLSKLDWVVVGGESGKGARPMHPVWVRSIRDDCKEAGVPFFFKQWGEYGTRWANMTTGVATFKEYNNYQHFAAKDWVMKGDKCISIDGRECKIGKDFMECAYPVVIMTKQGKKTSGRLLDGVLHDEYPARP